MMVQKTCRILITTFWALALFASSINSIVAQDLVPVPPIAQAVGRCGPGGCRVPQRPRCGPGGCRPPQVAQPQPPQVAPNQHRAVVATRSHFAKTTKHGWATAISFNNKFYLVSCAHIWYPNGQNVILINGNKVPIHFLGTSLADDLVVLKCPAGLPAMDLNQDVPPDGDALKLGYRHGTHLGYQGNDIVVKGYVKNGDSGGPIYNAKGLVGIIATYTYPNGKLLDGETSGPCATRIANFILSLTESPSLPPPVTDNSAILDRISKLEDLIANVKDGKDGADGKDGTSGQDTDCSELELKIQAIALGVQRNGDALELLQKAVLAQQSKLDVLEIKDREAVIRIQRLEQTVSSQSKSISTNSQTLKGKLRFRLRVDQSGRVIGVDPQ